MNKPKIQIIFEERENAEVRQDKGTPRGSYAASSQPQHAQTSPQVRPKHHGSQKRRVVEISGGVSKTVFAEVERMRQQGGKRLSRSAVVAALITRGVQEHTDMQYGALLEPVIRQQIHKDLQAYSNRIASLAVHARDSAEEARLLLIKVLSLLLNTDRQVLNHLIEEAKREARANMARDN
jgi:hypothetical protein